MVQTMIIVLLRWRKLLKQWLPHRYQIKLHNLVGLVHPEYVEVAVLRRSYKPMLIQLQMGKLSFREVQFLGNVLLEHARHYYLASGCTANHIVSFILPNVARNQLLLSNVLHSYYCARTLQL